MNAPPGHKHVSERQSGKWEDCLWMSAVMWLRLVFDPTIPATHAEGDALRLASGDLGFSNFWNLEAGVQVRYRWTLPDPVPPGALWATLAPGTAAVVIGNTGAWPSGSHWRRWSPGSVVDHAVFVYRFDATDAVWWCDPLAPEGAYNGEPMPKAELLRFVAKAGVAQLVAPTLEGLMTPAAITDETPVLMDTTAGAQVFELDGVTALTTLSAALTNRLSPYRVGGKRAIYVTTGGIRRVALVHPSATRPAPTADCAAAIQAAEKPLLNRIAAAKAALG
jgi:hypothetical protein